MDEITSMFRDVGLFLPYIVGLIALSSVVLLFAERSMPAAITALGAVLQFVSYVAMVFFTPSTESIMMQADYVAIHDMVSSLQFPGVAIFAVGLFVFSVRRFAMAQQFSGSRGNT